MCEKYEVVISGISGRFPECDDIETYKKMLYNKIDPITSDNRKWPVDYKYKLGQEAVPAGTGKYLNISKLDSRAFTMSHILANCTDIINRKTYEPAFEAVIDAGINPGSLSGRNIGVYTSCGICESEAVKLFSLAGNNVTLVGGSKTMMSSRIAFSLNLTGPSNTIYTGVLGNLDALSMAYTNISEGRIEAAIVGAGSSIIDPKVSVHFLRLGYLSSDGHCRSFDADADGYGRSEAIVMLFLQRAEDAKRSYGTLEFSECLYYGLNPRKYLNFDEKTIETVYKDIYDLHKNVNLEDISFVEMDGCGIKRLETLEANVLANFFCKNRYMPLLIGSVKSHTGHTEGSSSMLSILKALFALDSEFIAPNMHFKRPHPEIIPLNDGRLKVVSETTKLPGKVVGVSTLGFGGTVSHAVLKQNERIKKKHDDDNLPRLILLSGRSETGLREAINKVEMMPFDTAFAVLVNDVFQVPLSTHIHRAFTVLPAASQVNNGLDVVSGEKRPIWFVCSGMGSQWIGMGTGLLNIPVFAKAVDRCDKVLRPRGIDIRHILTTSDTTIFDNIVNSFVGIIIIQVGLIDILRTIGIEPDGIIGHSVGETACAYLDGCLSLEQAVLSSYARGIASTEVPTIKGMMAAIGKGYNEIRDSLPDNIEVACHNSADNCTLSGPADTVNNFVNELRKQKIFARSVNVSNIAYHSKHIVPAGPVLLKHLKEVIIEPKRRSKKWISTSVVEAEWEKPLAKYCSAEYLTNNLLSPVFFEEGCKHIPSNAVVIEIAPHGLLQAILKRSLSEQCSNISLTLRSQVDTVRFLLSAIGKLYLAGCHPDVNALYPNIEYPVPRGTTSISSLATWDHLEDWDSIKPLPDPSVAENLLQIRITRGSEFEYLRSYKIKNLNIIPPTVYLYLTWQMFSVSRNQKLGESNIVFENIKIHKNLSVTFEKYRVVTVLIQPGSGDFQLAAVNEEDSKSIIPIMTGTIKVQQDDLMVTVDTDLMKKSMTKVSNEEFYAKFKSRGFEMTNDFKNVDELLISETECFGKLRWNNNWVTFLNSLLTICLHSEHNKTTKVMFPSKIRRLQINCSDYSSLKIGDELICQKDLITNRLLCDGLEMVGVHFKPLDMDFFSGENSSFEMKSLRFIPHFNSGLLTLTAFLNMCLEIAVESAVTIMNKTNVKLYVANRMGNGFETVKQLINQNPMLQTKIEFFDFKNQISSSSFPFKQNCCLIMAHGFEYLKKLSSLSKNTTDNIFALVKESNHQKYKDSDFFVLAKDTFEEITIYLMKKVPENSSKPPLILKTDNNLATYKESLNSVKSNPVAIFKDSIEFSDLTIILSEQKLNPSVRYFYLMDANVPQFSEECYFYRKQIDQNLPVLVYKDGSWGSYRAVDTIIKKQLTEEQCLVEVPNITGKYLNIEYFSFDYEKSIVNAVSQIEPYGIEYSGTSDYGKKIMGLARYNPGTGIEKLDPLLSWEIPKSFDFEDAATVSLIYAQVYDTLFVLPTTDHSKSIFVNVGNILLTEAFVRICVQKGYMVYVTVADENESMHIKYKLNHLNENHILLRKDTQYELQLKLLTNGNGADIVINSFHDDQHLNSTMRCVAVFGYYMFMSDDDESESNIGMYPFAWSVSMHSLSNNICFILDKSEEEKRKLHDLVDEGLKNGTIAPLARTIFDRGTKIDKKLITTNDGKKKLFSSSLTQSQCNYTEARENVDRSYIIICGDKNGDTLFELIDWLVTQKARKFVVVTENYGATLNRINQLLTPEKIAIIVTSIKRTDSVYDSGKLIEEAIRLAPLESVFFLSVEKTQVISNMDLASRSFKPFHFVSLFSAGFKECETRRTAGLPAIFIYSNKWSNKLTKVLPQIKLILINYEANQTPILYQLLDKSIKPKKITSVSLNNYMSSKLEELEEIGDCITADPCFVEVASLSPKYLETKDNYPIFVIPSVGKKQLEPLIRRFIYPTFCSTLAKSSESAITVATQLHESLNTIQPKGPVTLIGETWSACIALELSELLQAAGRKVALFLIEGCPFMWRNQINLLGDINTPQFECNLVHQICGIPFDSKSIKNRMMYRTWDQCLQTAFENIKPEQTAIPSIKIAINAIRDRILIAAKYTRMEDVHSANITLFEQRPSESSLNEKWRLFNEVHLFEEENYSEFIAIPKISEIINDNALFAWFT